MLRVILYGGRLEACPQRLEDFLQEGHSAELVGRDRAVEVSVDESGLFRICSFVQTEEGICKDVFSTYDVEKALDEFGFLLISNMVTKREFSSLGEFFEYAEEAGMEEALRGRHFSSFGELSAFAGKAWDGGLAPGEGQGSRFAHDGVDEEDIGAL